MKRKKHREFLRLGPLRVRVGTAAECEQATIAVCGNVSFFADDVRGACSSCSAPIVYRPHVPTRPAKVCMECALVIMKGSQRPS